MNVICTSIIGTLGGAEYLGATTSLHILSLSLACSFIGGWIGNMMMLPSGRDAVCLRSGVISAVLNVVLNIFLIPIYGLNGAAFTTFLAELTGIIVKWPYIDKRIKIANLFKMIKAPLVGSFLIAIIGIVISKLINSYVLIAGITIGISAVVYALTLIIMKDDFFMGYMRPVMDRMRRNN